MKFNSAVKIFVLVVLSMILASCNAVSPTNPNEAVNVEATVNAVLTQSAESIKELEASSKATLSAMQAEIAATAAAQAAQPTAVPTVQPPAATAVPTIAPTAVVIVPTVVVPTAKPTVGPTATPSDYACSFVSITPAGKTEVTPGYDFDMVWTIKNVGLKSWSKDDVDFRYSTGTKFQKYADGYDFTTTVDSGKTIELRVDMKAPTTAGHYYATWLVVKGATTICTLPVDIIVK